MGLPQRRPADSIERDDAVHAGTVHPQFGPLPCRRLVSKRGQLRLVSRLSRDWASSAVCLTVADDGRGVPDQMKDDVFGQSVHSLWSEGQTSDCILFTGLSKLRGEVRVEDEDLRGPAFSIELPVESGDERFETSVGQRRSCRNGRRGRQLCPGSAISESGAVSLSLVVLALGHGSAENASSEALSWFRIRRPVRSLSVISD